MLASGVKVRADEIIPIIIDPDKANGDMTRTLDILKSYQRIRKNIHNFGNCDFFKAQLTTLNMLAAEKEGKIAPDEIFRFELQGVDNERFKDFIGYNQLDKVNKTLIDLLFSEENLASDMQLGFMGNPNIGSVVLNQFKDSSEFRLFASNFEENDRIFIISSIFGGTGAAGFPLVLKNIREAQDPTPNHAFLREARIGAITVLPYFGVEPDDNSRIDKATFVSKSKAALSYYERNISGNNSINALYYIGDPGGKDYRNAPGSVSQENDAHFVEICSALAIVDFMEFPDDQLSSENGKAANPIYKEYGLREDTQKIDMRHLGSWTRRTLMKPLMQYFYFCKYLNDEMESAVGTMKWTRGAVPITTAFLSQPFYREDLGGFNKHFWKWLQELDRNKRSFEPFNLSEGKRGLFGKIIGFEPSKSWNPFEMKDYVLFESVLNSLESKDKSPTAEEKLLSLFSKATEEIAKEKFNINER